MIGGRCESALVLASPTLTCYALTVRLVAATLSPLDVDDDANDAAAAVVSFLFVGF